MKPKVVISPRAVDEITQSIAWYNEQKRGLGKRYFTKLRSLIKTIQKTPRAFEIKYENLRGAIMDGFPFIVLYFISDLEEIVITAVFHTSRNPDAMPHE
ncbi:MAG: type II toxin-antitoxin system RelE/ParE family toxin [Bacteroidales bacterium]